ncbi:MAG: hypothetical protein ACRDRX_11220 [Pseudonocardiaceae bacterium]
MSTVSDHVPEPDQREIVLRRLARSGELTQAAASLPETSLLELRRAAYAIAWPIVYDRLTRRLETAKGHRACASSIKNMAQNCLDRFHDDVEAVIDYLFAHGDSPIHNLEGWITKWLQAATVDGHRKRRGALGAQQRPRVPKWLATALGDDRWLVTLAGRIIEWVGVPAAAGAGVWPLDTWTDLRGSITGDWRGATSATVVREIETVLRTMRTGNPGWYTRYIEQPLGRKQTAVAFTDTTTERDDAALSLSSRDDQDEANLTRLATLAVDAIASRLERGEDPHEVIPRIVQTLFTGPGAAAGELDRAPHDDRLPASPADEVLTRRVITAIWEILARRDDEQ